MVVSWWRQWMSPVVVFTILMLYRWEKARWPPPSLQVSNWRQGSIFYKHTHLRSKQMGNSTILVSVGTKIVSLSS